MASYRHTVTADVRDKIARIVRGESGLVKELPRLEDGYKFNWCPCGKTIIVSQYFPFDRPCAYCSNYPNIADAILSGAIKSVTQYAEYRRYRRNFDRRKRGNHICLECGVTLSRRSHAKTCSAKCRKAMSRSGVNVEMICE